MIDLFGNVHDMELKGESQYQNFRRVNGYRKTSKENRCKNCQHGFKVNFYERLYFKCDLMGVSYSSATDIRMNSVCNVWEER